MAGGRNAGTCRVKLSEHAGTSYCNHLYYHVMREIKERQIDAEIVFLHIPMLKNIDEFERLTETATGDVALALPPYIGEEQDKME
ncbi:hypothetical protein [Hungatella effluvii]|uniref:pyroglutamyl-peptidase I family protein n=1 Tax=Hungatella effluvii TaxID=1096246 RepID=UPI0022E6775F|nr:hypothetical protein [Hungatella effluvii]